MAPHRSDAATPIEDDLSELNVSMEIDLTQGQTRAIEALMVTGLFGSTDEDVILNLLNKGLQQAKADGWFDE